MLEVKLTSISQMRVINGVAGSPIFSQCKKHPVSGIFVGVVIWCCVLLKGWEGGGGDLRPGFHEGRGKRGAGGEKEEEANHIIDDGRE